MINTFPRWKYGLLLTVLFGALLYALPNLYGEDPAVQIAGLEQQPITESFVNGIKASLEKEGLETKSFEQQDNNLLIRFRDTSVQLKAKDMLKRQLGDQYSVAVNLAAVTPDWLSALGAKPMKLGLDLRGGVHFLMEVDLTSTFARRMDSYAADIRKDLREDKIRYKKLLSNKEQELSIVFDKMTDRDQAYSKLRRSSEDLDFMKVDDAEQGAMVRAILKPKAIQDLRNSTIEQTMTTLRKRVNELGVAEAMVQRQGLNRVVVELPGVQDTARAKDILGKTATLEFKMEDDKNEVPAVGARTPPGSKVYQERHGRRVLLKNQIILTGEAITGANADVDPQSGRPVVSIRLGGSGIGLFKRTTKNNVGKNMAVVYIETRIEEKMIDGKLVKQKKVKEDVISLATIQSALANRFQITGLKLHEARDLSLLLRAGALPAALSIVEERVVGPSMGADNIRMGMLSVGVGLGLVLVFMTIYYSVFGVVANITLLFNLVLLVALMSLLEATLTLPGIAGIVLTLGMAVDANVLIFERIREELRSGISPQASIHRGFENAIGTIVDANLTTLIVGIILFAVGTGPVKGFAVTLSLGILTSMFTAITGTRGLVNWIYGGKQVKRLLVGI